jgi:hypothetical protein
VAATPSLKVEKTFTYRGLTRTFSNRYHFVGGTPADNAHWTTFSDAVVTAEKALYPNTVTIVKTTGYAAGSEIPVFTKSYTTAGTFSGLGLPSPGDAAGLIRYATTARTSKNHPIYLFNYYHGVGANSSTTPDVQNSAQVTAYQTYAAAWVGAGFSDGTNSYNRAGPNGATATGYIVEPYITHRDLRR